MEKIFHRRNSISDLKSTPKEFGVEIDVRSFGKELIISHDPFLRGERFEDWLLHYNHGTLILNVKEEGLEELLLSYLMKYQINSYFFLDQSFPFLIKTSKNGEKKIAVRVSEYESIETALRLKDDVDWVWVDMFTKFHLTKNDFHKLKKANFKLCLVSPELQIQNKLSIKDVKKIIKEENIFFDAVCTKLPNQW